MVIFASAPEALVELCGISLLERLHRNLQRLGFRNATIVSNTSDEITRHLAAPSWARSDLHVTVVPDFSAASPSSREKVLLLRGDAHIDARLLETLSAREQPALLVDTAPPPAVKALLEQSAASPLGFVCGAALIERRQLENLEASPFAQLLDSAQNGSIAIIDLGHQPDYVVNLRRHLRPLWFPAPSSEQRELAEDLLLDAAQNGTLDLPAKIHAPIETWIIRRLCQTPITPNQITLFTAAVATLVTFLFAAGHLVAAIILALAVGVLDGLDGKQARVKVETTRLGKREHVLDYLLELSWWTALAFHFTSNHQIPDAYWWLALLVGSDLVDRVAKAVVKNRTGRNLDDISPFDRFVRLIGGRRNIYVWMFAAGLALGIADQAFVALCTWGALTAAAHALRAGAISTYHPHIT